MVKVSLKGLNIVKARGRYYVYVRETGEKLLGGFEGDKKALVKRLEMPDMIQRYNAKRQRERRAKYPDGTLGALVTWFETECPEYRNLSDATKKDYSAAFKYLTPEFDVDLTDIDRESIYETRDRCAMDRKTRFADKMVSALSSMFSQAVSRGKMKDNPALGVKKAHSASKSANREWSAEEVENALAASPANLRTVLMLARYAGFRGQTIFDLTWREYQDDPAFGKCFRTTTRKSGGELVWVPAMPELRDHLASAPRTALTICTKADGTPWDNEVQMQTSVSKLLRKLEKDGIIGRGTTLHGLRVTYAADLRRSGADAGQVAAALGDKSERMGVHYTRHVENEAKVINAFKGKAK